MFDGLMELVNLLTAPLAYIIIRIYFSTFLGAYKSTTLSKLAVVLHLTWQIVGLNSDFVPMILKMPISIGCILLICICGYKGSFLLKIIHTVMISVVWGLMEFLTIYMFMLVNASEIFVQLSGSLISKALTLLMILLIRMFFRSESVKWLNGGYAVMLFSIPVGSLFLVYNIFSITSQNVNRKTVILLMFGVVIVLAINLIMFKLFTIISHEFAERKRKEMYIQKMQMLNKHIIEKENMIQEYRKERHNNKFHFSVIRGLLEDKNYDEVVRYLSEILNVDEEEKVVFSKTGNIIVDAIVNEKFTTAQKKDVDVQAEIFIPAQMEFEDTDIGILLGNILDNAIEACISAAGRKYVNLYMRYEQGTLMITCINSYDGVLKKGRFGMPQTLKKDEVNHGFGLKTIEALADKYRGSMVIENNENEFKLKVMLLEM